MEEEKKIKFFSIISPVGAPYLTLKLDDKLNENLLSGLLSAIYTMGRESLDEQISNISVQGGTFKVESFITKDLKGDTKYINFALVSKDFDHNEFVILTEKVIADFDKNYGEVLKNWDGDTSLFGNYYKTVEKIISEQFSQKYVHFESKLDDIFSRIANGDIGALDELNKDDEKS